VARRRRQPSRVDSTATRACGHPQDRPRRWTGGPCRPPPVIPESDIDDWTFPAASWPRDCPCQAHGLGSILILPSACGASTRAGEPASSGQLRRPRDLIGRRSDDMRALGLVCIVLLIVVSQSAAAERSGPVRISQVYAGGGDLTYQPQAYRTDYVELLNSGGTPVDVSGWLLEYGGATATSHFGCTGCTGIIPAGIVIQACSYLLVQVGPTNTHPSSTAPYVPAPDVILESPSLEGAGPLALLTSGTILTGFCLTDSRVQDLVEWGGGSCAWGLPAAPLGLDLTDGLVRLDGGMSSIGDNSLDFTVVLDPVPRRSSSPANDLCLQTPAIISTWGRLKTIFR
jgi:hypothetical protein